MVVHTFSLQRKCGRRPENHSQCACRVAGAAATGVGENLWGRTRSSSKQSCILWALREKVVENVPTEEVIRVEGACLHQRPFGG